MELHHIVIPAGLALILAGAVAFLSHRFGIGRIFENWPKEVSLMSKIGLAGAAVLIALVLLFERP